jgi:hypothetical protein
MCKFESGLISNKCKLFLGRVKMSQRILQAQLKTAQAETRPKFLIELAKPTQSKNKFKKCPTARQKDK